MLVKGVSETTEIACFESDVIVNEVYHLHSFGKVMHSEITLSSRRGRFRIGKVVRRFWKEVRSEHAILLSEHCITGVDDEDQGMLFLLSDAFQGAVQIRRAVASAYDDSLTRGVHKQKM